jgi:hypothetical protein
MSDLSREVAVFCGAARGFGGLEAATKIWRPASRRRRSVFGRRALAASVLGGEVVD